MIGVTVYRISSSFPVPQVGKLYKRVDEVELGQPTPSFSREVKPACRGPQEKCPHPPDGCSVTGGFTVLSCCLIPPPR